MTPLLAITLTVLLGAAHVGTSSETRTDHVRALAAFDGAVIACTGGGLDVFAPDGRVLRTLRREDGLPSNDCAALRVDRDRLQVATAAGMAVLGQGLRVEQLFPGTWRAVPPHGVLTGAATLPTGATITAFSEAFAGIADGRVIRLADGRVWSVAGTVERLEETADALRIGTAETRYLLRGEELSELPRVGPGPLAFARDGNGVQVIDRDGRRFPFDGGPDLAIRAPAGTRAWLHAFGETWVGTSRGVATLEGTRWTFRTRSHALCGNHVTALGRFRGRQVVGTFDDGVCWRDPNGRWTSFRAPALPSDHVLGVAFDGARLYVATEYGLGLWDGRRWTQLSVRGRNPFRFQRLSILGAAELGGGEVALFDGRGTSYVRNGKLVRRVELPPDWAKHLSVVAAAPGLLAYASEDRGLLLTSDARHWTAFHDGNALPDNWVTALDVDRSGRALAGTCQNGFGYFDGRRWTRVSSSAAMRTLDVTAVALSPDGGWVGTLDGLYRFDARTGELTRVRGVPDPRISALRVEQDGVWVGTQDGLRFLPSEPGPRSHRPAGGASEPSPAGGPETAQGAKAPGGREGSPRRRDG